MPDANFPALLGNIPEPVKATFLKATSRLVGGLLSYPAAHLRRLYQPVEDQIDVKTSVAKGLAAALVERVKGDPVLMQAVEDAYLPDVLRKLRNKMDIVVGAAEEVAQKSILADGAAKEVDDDWINAFIRFSEDASSERLKKLFSKFLAGEIVNPGKFSIATLRIASELTMEIAKEFQYVFEKSIEGWVYQFEEFRLGSGYNCITRLRDAGLIGTTSFIHQPKHPSLRWQVGDLPAWLLIQMSGQIGGRFPMIDLTRCGIELGSVLPPRDIEKNLRAIAAVFPKRGVESIVLVSPLTSEMIYRTDS